VFQLRTVAGPLLVWQRTFSAPFKTRARCAEYWPVSDRSMKMREMQGNRHTVPGHAAQWDMPALRPPKDG